MQGQTIDSIYFGGGTPSLLPLGSIESIFKGLRIHFKINPIAEVTLEANPEDISRAILQDWFDIGINRLSIGIQSFHESDLTFMNRNHEADVSHRALDLACGSKINNIGGDLMFGLIGRDIEDWKVNLKSMVAYPMTHLSVYNLTIEEQTVFHKWEQDSKIKESSSKVQEEQFEFADHFLNQHGYEHYEISNYAKKGFKAVHNTNYWKGVPYLGIGPSAHSFNGSERNWNIANNAKYIKQLESNSYSNKEETLDEYDRFNEMIMLGLRTKWGIAKAGIKGFTGDIQEHFEGHVLKMIDQGILKDSDGYIILSKDKWYLSDSICSDLFIVKE